MADDELTTQVDIPAERAVLGAMILYPTAIERGVEILSRGDFYSPVHAELFDFLKVRFLNSEPISAIAITTALADMKSPVGKSSFLDWIGGAPYIHTLISTAVSPVVDYYADILTDKSLRRRIYRAGVRIASMAANPNGDTAASLVDRVIQETESLRPGNSHEIETTASVLKRLSGKIGQRVEGLSTGFTDLDKKLGPLTPGHVMIIAGRPSQGKSVLALDIARHVSMNLNSRVIYVTLEMSTDELMIRNISATAKVPFANIRDGNLTSKESDDIELAMAKLERIPLELWDRPNVSIGDLNAEIRTMSRSSPVGMVIVDYLQLMQVDSRINSREQQVADLSRNFKLSAKKYGFVGVMLAQLNRGPEQRIDKRPLLSDLRESGGLEQDADSGVFVHRPSYYDINDRPGEGDLMLLKSRNGETGIVPVAAQLHWMKFVDLAMTAVR